MNLASALTRVLVSVLIAAFCPLVQPRWTSRLPEFSS